jgi:hypothetical protein
LPQHLLALALWSWLKARGKLVSVQEDPSPPGNIICRIKDSYSGVSLGRYIFMGDRCTDETLCHERGHSFQSLATGPLYLLLIGLPSAVGNNLWDRLMHQSWSHARRVQWYYRRYPEAGSDRLGNLPRGRSGLGGEQ